MKINRSENCGNAPKQTLIADLNIAFAQADAAAVSAFFIQIFSGKWSVTKR